VSKQICLFDEAALFTAIEFNFPMLISPIMMVPKAIGTGQLQALYLKNDPEMAIRIGPINADRNRELTAVGVSKSVFTPRFNLVGILQEVCGLRTSMGHRAIDVSFEISADGSSHPVSNSRAAVRLQQH
jgi:hypothetical protein